MIRSALVLAVLCTSSCYVPTQRLPRPMSSRYNPLPAGARDQYPQGQEEVLIIRHADPVQVRPAGIASSYPMRFYDKQERVNSGSWVFSGAGGRAEVLWPSGASVVFFGRGTGIVGSPSRGEPTFLLRECERASISLKTDDRVELLGGALLIAESGPFIVEQEGREILRIRNRSKGTGRVAYREQIFDLDPGHVLDLPLLGVGTAPVQVDPAFETLSGSGVTVDVRGDVEAVEDNRGLRLRASGNHEMRAQGIRVRLDEGEEVLFRDLHEPVRAPEPTPEEAPAPLEENATDDGDSSNR